MTADQAAKLCDMADRRVPIGEIAEAVGVPANVAAKLLCDALQARADNWAVTNFGEQP